MLGAWRARQLAPLLPPARHDPCRRSEKREGLDIDYLKNVLLRAFESGARGARPCGPRAPLSAHARQPWQATLPGSLPALAARPGLPPCRCAHGLSPGFKHASAGELPAGSAMVPVLARLLEFSPQELARVQAKAAAQPSFFRLPGLTSPSS